MLKYKCEQCGRDDCVQSELTADYKGYAIKSWCGVILNGVSLCSECKKAQLIKEMEEFERLGYYRIDEGKLSIDWSEIAEMHKSHNSDSWYALMCWLISKSFLSPLGLYMILNCNKILSMQHDKLMPFVFFPSYEYAKAFLAAYKVANKNELDRDCSFSIVKIVKE